MDDLGAFADVRRGWDLLAAVALGDQLPPVGAGPEQQQAAAIRRHAHEATRRGASAMMRRAGAHRLTDGEDMANPVAWPTGYTAGAAPANQPQGTEPLQLPPVPIAASPAGWDGEPWLHQPLGTRIVA